MIPVEQIRMLNGKAGAKTPGSAAFANGSGAPTSERAAATTQLARRRSFPAVRILPTPQANFHMRITSVRTLFEQIQLVSRMCLNVIGDGFVK